MPSLEPSRLPELMSHDRAELDDLLASTVLGHIGFVHDGHPVVMPSGVIAWGDRLVTHGSTGSRWLRLIASGVPVSVSLATVDGVVVARSAFESAVIYRSAVLFGSFSPLAQDEKTQALDVLTERLLPGRVSELRRPTRRELAATLTLAMPIEQWSLRILDQWPDDPDPDVAGPAWAGLVRFGPRPSVAAAAPDLRDGVDLPPSVSEVVAGRPLLLS